MLILVSSCVILGCMLQTPPKVVTCLKFGTNVTWQTRMGSLTAAAQNVV